MLLQCITLYIGKLVSVVIESNLNSSLIESTMNLKCKYSNHHICSFSNSLGCSDLESIYIYSILINRQRKKLSLDDMIKVKKKRRVI